MHKIYQKAIKLYAGPRRESRTRREDNNKIKPFTE